MAYINDSFIENVTSLINSTDVPIMVKDTVGVGFFFLLLLGILLLCSCIMGACC